MRLMVRNDVREGVSVRLVVVGGEGEARLNRTCERAVSTEKFQRGGVRGILTVTIIKNGD